MTQQLDFFKAPAPVIEQACFIGADNSLILFPPSPLIVMGERLEGAWPPKSMI